MCKTCIELQMIKEILDMSKKEREKVGIKTKLMCSIIQVDHDGQRDRGRVQYKEHELNYCPECGENVKLLLSKRCKICKGEVDDKDLVNIELGEVYKCSYCSTVQTIEEMKGDQ